MFDVPSIGVGYMCGRFRWAFDMLSIDFRLMFHRWAMGRRSMLVGCVLKVRFVGFVLDSRWMFVGFPLDVQSVFNVFSMMSIPKSVVKMVSNMSKCPPVVPIPVEAAAGSIWARSLIGEILFGGGCG